MMNRFCTVQIFLAFQKLSASFGCARFFFGFGFGAKPGV